MKTSSVKRLSLLVLRQTGCFPLPASITRPHGIKGGAGGNEQRAPIFAAEDELEWAFRHLNNAQRFALTAIDVDLARGNIHIAVCVDRDAFASLFSEQPPMAQAPVGARGRGPGCE